MKKYRRVPNVEAFFLALCYLVPAPSFFFRALCWTLSLRFVGQFRLSARLTRNDEHFSSGYWRRFPACLCCEHLSNFHGVVAGERKEVQGSCVYCMLVYGVHTALPYILSITFQSSACSYLTIVSWFILCCTSSVQQYNTHRTLPTNCTIFIFIIQNSYMFRPRRRPGYMAEICRSFV